MKKITLTLAALCSFYFANAQEAEQKSNWTKGGEFAILGSQSGFNNWQSGGVNNISINATVNYLINYKNDDITWDNRFFGNYGLAKMEKQDYMKTDDRIEITSTFGKRASEFWHYSFLANLRTQFAPGYDPKDLTAKTSQFLSPMYLEAGPGMLYKNIGIATEDNKISDFISVNISPASARLIYVNSIFTENGPSFGVEQGKTTRFEFGASVQALARKKVMENFTVESKLGLYSNYLDKPKNVDIDFMLSAVFKVNKYISTNVTFQTIYDDNTYKGFQTRHNLGIGFSYSL